MKMFDATRRRIVLMKMKNANYKCKVKSGKWKVESLAVAQTLNIKRSTSSILALQVPEIHRYKTANARFLHRNTIDHIHSTHCHFVVGYDDKL